MRLGMSLSETCNLLLLLVQRLSDSELGVLLVNARYDVVSDAVCCDLCCGVPEHSISARAESRRVACKLHSGSSNKQYARYNVWKSSMTCNRCCRLANAPL